MIFYAIKLVMLSGQVFWSRSDYGYTETFEWAKLHQNPISARRQRTIMNKKFGKEIKEIIIVKFTLTETGTLGI
jgi:hypothetical protein